MIDDLARNLFFNFQMESAAGTVKRIVLTGGPCGGKSSVQALLSDVFENIGWKGLRCSFRNVSNFQSFVCQRLHLSC